MDGKQALIETTEREYARLRAAVDGLGEGQMSEAWLGTWGVREILAHIAGWHREMAPALERLARGEPPYADGAYDDFDRWNARFVDARQGVKAAAIVREVDESHREFLRAVARLPDADLAEGRTARGLVDGVGANHYREHAEQIAAWRGRPRA
ncbi:MAG TPA: ClbS/DfsB family four-helix bundle protein [Methylomirabilota bacterium]|jgi:hypothetical protein|nr:ClbS/DfsB family four-helix bundle protein [Methylomirabilota bacterium]